MTTITPSVRYLSIHAWLVHSFAQARSPDRWSDFRSFAGRAESALVLGNLILDPGTVGLIGSDKGRVILDSGDRRLPLDQLVKQLAVSVYANPSSQLGLTFTRDSGVPGLSRERGLPLARRLESNVRRSTLGEVLSDGKRPAFAELGELEELGHELDIRNIPKEEVDLLLEALLPKTPQPSDLSRMGTYGSLLFLARELGRVPHEGELFAVTRDVERTFPTEVHGILNGWLRYSVRDLLSTVGESAFKVVITTLDQLSDGGQRAVPTGRVLDSLLGTEASHTEELHRLGLVTHRESVWNLRFSDLHERVASGLRDPKASSGGLNRWTGPLHEWAIMDSALALGPWSLSMLPVAWSLATFRAAPWDSARKGALEVRSDLGSDRLGFDEVIRPTVSRFLRERTGLLDATRELTLRTIDQHLRVAWSRMATDMRRDVSALTTDGDDWCSRQKAVFAGRTASRLPEAISWLQQLRLIDESGVTPEGKKALSLALRALREASP